MTTAAFSESAIGLAIRRAAEKLGYSKLRHQQVRAVKNFVQGNDVVLSLPTGSGKSLCYCILPATFDSLFGADGRHLARCIFLSDCDNQILYAFRVNYHYVTAYRADLKTLAGAPRRNSPRDYVWFTRLGNGDIVISTPKGIVEPRLLLHERAWLRVGLLEVNLHNKKNCFHTRVHCISTFILIAS